MAEQEFERKLAEASQRLEQAERVIAAADGLRWNGCLTAFGGVNPYLEAYDTERAKLPDLHALQNEQHQSYKGRKPEHD